MVKTQPLILSALQQCARPSKHLAKYCRNFVCKILFKNSTPGQVSELIILKAFLIVIIYAKRFLLLGDTVLLYRLIQRVNKSFKSQSVST